ncbi:hypothetical protein AB0I28_23675 [Phytomonospora sp. NPDC050363]|uniref:hypothetical protein n=1 Tax=Phytomonospora sp. NPDC050363 TaxID=3155642 RepID=UPI0033F865C7
MSDRRGHLSERMVEPGKRMLVLPDDTWVLVDADADHSDLMREHELDHVEVAPQHRPAVYLDGPLAGQAGHAPRRLGRRMEVGTGEADGRRLAVYAVTGVGDPVELRFRSYEDPPPPRIPDPGMAAIFEEAFGRPEGPAAR